MRTNRTPRRSAPLLAMLVLAGCGGAARDEGNATPVPEERPAAKPPADIAPEAQPVPGPESPVAPDGAADAEAAAEVVRTYYALIAARRYDEAWRLRSNGSGKAPPEFVEQFAAHSELRATVGTPSRIEGAAGSLYVEIPVQLYGRRTDGAPFASAGTITLRRSNDVPGATAEQRSWRIYASD